jgi:plasmid stabilization system protein ParE
MRRGTLGLTILLISKMRLRRRNRVSPCHKLRAEPEHNSNRCLRRAGKEHVKMPRGDKSSYTPKQKRQARDIEEGYEERGVPESEAARRAWATVNKMTGGGRKSGSGRGKTTNKAPARKGGKIGGHAAAARPKAARTASAKKSAATRRRAR